MRVTFITAGGKRTISTEGGRSLMGVAVDNDIDGIAAQCGGALSCGTCHVYVDPDWQARIGDSSEDESYVLDGVENRRPNSRLSCQIKLVENLDGLVVHVPDSPAAPQSMPDRNC